MTFVVGEGDGERVPVCGQELAWFESFGVKGGSTQDFLSAFPNVGQRGRLQAGV